MPDEDLTDNERQRQIDEAWEQHHRCEEAPRSHPKREWLQLHFENQKGFCFYCDGEMTLDTRQERFREGRDDAPCATLDHMVPKSDQGPDTFENTCAACNSCNYAKGSFPLALFLAWCKYAIHRYDDIAERRRYLQLEAAAERYRLQTALSNDKESSHD